MVFMHLYIALNLKVWQNKGSIEQVNRNIHTAFFAVEKILIITVSFLLIVV